MNQAAHDPTPSRRALLSGLGAVSLLGAVPAVAEAVPLALNRFSGLTLTDLAAAYDALDAAKDGLAAIENQPRCQSDAVLDFLGAEIDRAARMMEEVIEAARAHSANNMFDRRAKANTLMKWTTSTGDYDAAVEAVALLASDESGRS